ncbi:hypothetical protein [Nisaea sp.]|uniref:hypothetical protein n=1 Tax=Nisaea sp. TaxID=2024842 RepID=UPI003B52A401
MTEDATFRPIGSRTKDEIRGENFCESEIYLLERARLSARRRKFGGGDADRFTGLAISGGGIRSATFALGLLQSLARHDLLKGFDYLSTVSGGGYVGSCLSWLLGRNYEKYRAEAGAGSGPYGLGSADFPFGTAPPKDRANPAHWDGMLRYLREHAEYLAPNNDISLLSGVAVVVRGILLNLLVWVPVFMAIFLISMLGVRAPGWPDLRATVMEGVSTDPHMPEAAATLLRPGFLNLHEIVLIAGLSGLVFFSVVSLVYSVGTFFITRRHDADWSYGQRRLFESSGKWILPLSVLALAVGALPYMAAVLHNALGSVGGAGAGAMATGMVSALVSAKKTQLPLVRNAILPAMALLVLAGFLVLTCTLALVVRESGNVIAVSDSDGHWIAQLGIGNVVFLGFLAVALLSGYLVNANYISLHRFYRDRLMEAFMPMPGSISGNRVDRATGANIEELRMISDPETGAPYHLVNTNLILTESGNSLYRRRGGDNFVMSRLYCGGDAGGYQPTVKFSGGDMTLATAMTISGAAANPNAGWAGTGATRMRSVSWLMSLLNIRLGYFVRNRNAPKFLWYSGKPSHFDVMASSIGLSPLSEKGKWFQLSDGGHFENLAVYELIRRRCRLILVSDAGADPDFRFGDLQNTVRRVSQDFGVSVDFGKPFYDRDTYVKAFETEDGSGKPELGESQVYDHWRNRVSSLVPRRETGFPVNGTAADHGYIIGRIRYPAFGNEVPEEEGVIVYVKAVMLDGLSLETRGYKTDHPAFPHEPTSDQFFDPGQFEAYRELGNAIGEDMIRGARLRTLLSRAWGAADDGA